MVSTVHWLEHSDHGYEQFWGAGRPHRYV